VVRAFAIHLCAIDPATEVPPAALLPWRPCRATPYLYSEQDIAALTAAAVELQTTHRTATYQTLIGLLAVTGMRVGEAIGLDRSDFDPSSGVLIIRNTKFGKSREIPLHSSVVDAVSGYLQRTDRPPIGRPAPLLVSTAGSRLLYQNVLCTFRQLVRRAGLKPRSASCRPRLHDFRHSFAVRTVIDGYRNDGDPAGKLSLLSTYLGHTDPSATYWYLSAAPELLALAGSRRERPAGGAS
jgi:integrase